MNQPHRHFGLGVKVLSEIVAVSGKLGRVGWIAQRPTALAIALRLVGGVGLNFEEPELRKVDRSELFLIGVAFAKTVARDPVNRCSFPIARID